MGGDGRVGHGVSKRMKSILTVDDAPITSNDAGRPRGGHQSLVECAKQNREKGNKDAQGSDDPGEYLSHQSGMLDDTKCQSVGTNLLESLSPTDPKSHNVMKDLHSGQRVSSTDQGVAPMQGTAEMHSGAVTCAPTEPPHSHEGRRTKRQPRRFNVKKAMDALTAEHKRVFSQEILILHLNIRGLRTSYKTESLKEMGRQLQFGIGVITETHLLNAEAEALEIPGYRVIAKDGHDT